MKNVTFLILSLLIFNCSPMKSLNQISDSEKLLSYERTPCFGFCQTYGVTVLPDGQAWFTGYRYVPILDTVQFEIPEKTMTQIRSILNHPLYLDYVMEEPEYQVTDIPGLNFSDYSNGRKYELDQIIPPAIEKMTGMIDEVLAELKLIYDQKTYPMVREEILVELTPGTDPHSLDGQDNFYELSFQEELGAGIYVYRMTCPVIRIEDALKAVKQRKGVREAQMNHRLDRR